MGKKTRLAKEGAKFTAVNILATAVALVGFNLLTHGVYGWFDGPMNARPLSAYVAANSLGMLISFFGIRHFVYKHRRPMGPGGGFVNYAAVNLSSFIFPLGCLWVTRNLFDWDSAISDNISGNVVGAGLAMVFRFWAFRRFVFKVDPPIFKRPLGPNPHVAHAHHVARTGSVLGGGPEVRPHEAELLEHQPEEGKADPDHVVRVPGDARHERAPEPVEGEGPGHVQRFS